MERLSRPEHEAHRPEAELEKLAAERLKHLEKSPESAHHKGAEIETAREKLRHVEKPSSKETAPQPIHRLISKAHNYRQTMVSLQHRLKPASRRFSKLIHTPVIESASEIVGKTVMRPSVSLGATATAVLVTLFLYLSARAYGFQLRGSEIWISLVVGAILGLLLEGIYKSIRRISGKI